MAPWESDRTRYPCHSESPEGVEVRSTVKQALSLVDIRTLDHFVVAGGRVTSFAERGLL